MALGTLVFIDKAGNDGRGSFRVRLDVALDASYPAGGYDILTPFQAAISDSFPTVQMSAGARAIEAVHEVGTIAQLSGYVLHYVKSTGRLALLKVAAGLLVEETAATNVSAITLRLEIFAS